ncbi:MAG TPA: hypothetical protein VKB84_16170 [Candidatus Binataceae bacterium]|nr:hypothetical protein [Candidatus Binataceae bacterium]
MTIQKHVDDPIQARFEASLMNAWLSPEVQTEVERCRRLFFEHPLSKLPEAEATLERSLGETTRSVLDWIVNGDPFRPATVWMQTPPHRWFGVDFKGDRWGIDNPDNLYGYACIEDRSRYVVRGKMREPALSEFTLTVMERGGPYPDAFPHSACCLTADQIVTEMDGSFLVTVDSQAANGRSNHMRTTAGTVGLLQRYSFGDWTHEMIPHLSVERVGGPPMPPEPANDEWVRQAVEKLRSFFPAMIDFLFKASYRKDANQIGTASPTPGGLLTQMTSFGHFHVHDDEALILRIDPVGAGYLGFQLYDHWGIGMEYVSATGSLNHAQAALDNDGNYRLVISPTDPGVQNWVDTERLHAGGMLVRWQSLPFAPKAMEGIIDSKLVKLSRLMNELPADTPLFSAEDRRRQIQQREQGYARRIGMLRG